MNLQEIINKAKKINSYFVVVTTRDKAKTENDLTHYVFQQDFPIEDIITSLDTAIRSMNIKPEKPADVVILEEIKKEKPPLKIAVISHFNRCPDSYAPCRAVRSQIRMLQEFGHKVIFFLQEGSPLEMDCEMRKVMPKFRREKNIVDEEGKKKLIDVLREHLTSEFDIAITHDFYIDDCITYREAVKECGVPIKWLHWARSGVGHQIDFAMDNARYVYMNYTDVGHFARNIGVNPNNVRVVFNEKDLAYTLDWHPVTRAVVDKFQLYNRDVIQTYPICTTRMDAKGIDSVIKVFVELKRLGNRVALVVCNSNGRRRVEEIKAKVKWAKDIGLNENELIFTSMLPEEYETESEVPHRAVMELMQVSNLFVFPTAAEVCPNALLEASTTKNLIVVNKDLPCLFDFVDKDAVLSYPFTSNKSLHYSGRDSESLERLARKIDGQLKSNKSDRQFRRAWRIHNRVSIYKRMLEPILYENV